MLAGFTLNPAVEVPEVPVKVELRVVESVKSNSRFTCIVLYIYKLQFTT